MRAIERGVVSAGRDAKTGENHMPKLERAENIHGLRFTWRPRMLRFFMGRFEEV